jgi:hypothetical protein
MTATATTPDVATTEDPTKVSFTIADLPLALLKTEKKDESGHYYAFRDPKGKYTGFGHQVPALEDELPTSVTVDGVEFTLEKGKTSDEKRTRNADGSTTVTKVEPRDKVSFQGNTTLPSLGERTVKVIVSVTKSGDWNINATVTKVHSVSPEDRKAKAKERAEDNLARILAALGQG